MELFIGHTLCYYQNMLNLDEFINLIMNADEDTIFLVEQILEEFLSQFESPE